MTESIRRRAGFTKHVQAHFSHVFPGLASNIVIPRSEDYSFWLADITAQIGEWRSYMRDVYLRWAITINAMHVATEHWRGRPPDTALQTVSLRASKDGRAEYVPIAVWPAATAVENYQKATPLLAAYGVSDLFGALEEVIFEMYETYLSGEPDELMRGEEFRHLRRLYKQRDNGEESSKSWDAAWVERLSKWRRKRAYDGLHNVFRSFFQKSGLKRPSTYTHTDIDDWCQTIEAIGELRNSVTHGMGTVTHKLSELTKNMHTDVFKFVEGDLLHVELQHLMFVECFANQLLSAINVACLERAIPNPTAGR